MARASFNRERFYWRNLGIQRPSRPWSHSQLQLLQQWPASPPRAAPPTPETAPQASLHLHCRAQQVASKVSWVLRQKDWCCWAQFNVHGCAFYALQAGIYHCFAEFIPLFVDVLQISDLCLLTCLCLLCRFFVHGSTEIAALLAELADASSLDYMLG